MAGPARRETPRAIGRYEILEPRGTGAMGRVLLARDPVLDRLVAIKVLRDDLQIPEDVRDGLLVRMRHEARAAARVSHPHLVTIHDMGEDPALGLYLVFEWLEGPTLKQRLAEGRLSPRQAARVAKDLGGALSFAHERGVLHRDVKPENVMLTPSGTKLTDFGIARIPDSTLTHAGGLLGTPAYSAPETFREGRFSDASDQFSLAATIYEAISGARAFPGDDAVSVAAKITTDAPKPFAASLGLPAELDAVLARGMAKSPGDRYPSCRELGIAVVDCLLPHETPSPARGDAASALALARVSSAPEVLPPPERKPWRVALGGLAVVGLATWLVRTAQQPADAEPVPAASASAPVASGARPAPPPRPRSPRPAASLPTPSAPPPSSASAPPPTLASSAPASDAPPSASEAPPTRRAPTQDPAAALGAVE
jgi:serine/threonine-protein kinase